MKLDDVLTLHAAADKRQRRRERNAMNQGIAMPIAQPILRPQRCETCGNCGHIDGAPGERDCRKEPPRLIMVPSQQGPKAISVFPRVELHWWCAGWKPVVELAP